MAPGIRPILIKSLINMHSVLGIGRRVVLLVPAFNSLYGTVDRALDHYRR